ncbi:MAG: hypothetical protein WCV85_05915 [Patescibacteria group bacterium]|jgi:hypothetical protein
MKRSFHIGIACACGAGIGTLIALSIGGLWWWVGALIGALCGYIIIDFRGIPKKIKTAWLSTFTWWGDKANIRVFAHFSACLSIMLLWLGILALSFTIAASNPGTFLSGLMGVGFIVSIGMVLITLAIMDGSAPNVKNGTDSWYEAALAINPLAVFLYWIPKGAFIFFAQLLPSFAKKFSAFLKVAFRLIHSDVRVLCAVDAALGTCLGYFLGHVFYGVGFGFVFGLLSYEIVSKRIQKRIPVRS